MCRDRLTVLKDLVAWLEGAGQQRIVLVDVQSTYEPLLNWLAATPHMVERLDQNLGHRAPWLAGLVAKHGGERNPYVVTDCDVLPDEQCPADAVDHLAEELVAHPSLLKVGLSLRIDDVPDEYPRVEAVRHWEQRYYQRSVSESLWAADVDTTFAIYRPGVPYATHPAARTKSPYRARHLPWYRTGAPPPDEAHYLDQARLGDTTWNLKEVPEWLQRNLEGRGPARVPGRLEAKVRHIASTRHWS